MLTHNDVKRFRDRAEELLTLAEHVVDFTCKRRMLRMVAEYELLALHTEERLIEREAEVHNLRSRQGG